MAKKQKKKNKKLHWVVLLLTLVMLCGCAALGYFVFEIKEIKVEGSQRFSQEEVIAQSGVQQAKPVFGQQKPGENQHRIAAVFAFRAHFLRTARHDCAACLGKRLTAPCITTAGMPLSTKTALFYSVRSAKRRAFNRGLCAHGHSWAPRFRAPRPISCMPMGR
ncbi:MAG: hypothetical protein ACLT0Y_08825 [Christensenellales bacterium]